MTDSLQDSHDSRVSDSEKSIKLDAVSARRVWLKLDLFLLPVIAMFYLLSFLDRTNIGNARIAGLQRDLQMTNKQYSIALTVTYVPYIVAELPSNLLLRVIGPNYLLPTLLTIWGIDTALQGAVTSYGGLLVCRFFLGVFEGGVFPGLVLYLTHFYPRAKMTTRVAAFFASASLSGAFSGILAYGIIRMDGVGGHAGWRWIFILEGAFTVAWGLMSYFLMPRDALAARFLRPTERKYVASQVAESGRDKFEWREVRKAFLAPHVWILGIIFFFSGAVLYGLAYFTPSIVQSLGYTAARSQLMSVPPFAAAFALSMSTAYLIHHIPHLVINKDPVWQSLLSIPGVYTSAPTLSTWNSANSAPHVRRATAIALGFMMTNAGGILSTWLLGSLSTAPKYVLGTRVMIAFSGGMTLGSALCLGYFVLMNQKKRKMQGQDGPELVIAIITEFVSNGTRGSLVRGPLTVCKLWADITMDLIWRQIGDPSAIFRLLAPVENRPADQGVLYDWNYSFKSLPMPSGWARFDLYRHRVRILDDTSTSTNYRSIISDVAVLGLDSTIFLPNLTDFSRFYVQDDMWRDSVFFMHEGIETFTLMLELGDRAIYEPILQYFEHIAARMPRLQNFTLQAPAATHIKVI
ncbi:MFS general substrate transporter [Armillaria gallica]|uniref:MFS general substrate transporter n=1 Tax=Armillaria gallica TaxID=47427 RepID=A0A2H3CMC5_ARMGA|nr:MFS general substrate transporter [Armillaria gallica]